VIKLKKKKGHKYKRPAYIRTQNRKGYVIRQPVTFGTSMDDDDI
jgi:hypothetical protein